MNLFENLPDEKLVEICEQMDVQTLGRTSQTYKRLHEVCSEVSINKAAEKEYEKARQQNVSYQLWQNKEGKFSEMDGINFENGIIEMVHISIPNTISVLPITGFDHMSVEYFGTPINQLPIIYKYLISNGFKFVRQNSRNQ